MRQLDKKYVRFNFAADSDVIINLSKIASGVKLLGKDNKLGFSLQKLWEMVYSGDVKLYVTPQILCELSGFEAKFSEQMATRQSVMLYNDVAKFIRAYCFPIYISPKNEPKFKHKAKILATEYAQNAGFEYKIFPRKSGREVIVPCRDAKALAEASMCGLSFLTCNTGDIVATRLSNGVLIADKLEHVKKINTRHSLGYPKRDVAWTSCPIPMSVIDFIDHLPNCYMDIPFLRDTGYDVRDIKCYEVEGPKQYFFAKFDKFLMGVESGEIEVVPLGIEHPYSFRRLAPIDSKYFDPRNQEEIIKF